MSGDHNQYQKDKSYLDFECPRCGHCCQAKEEDQEPVAWANSFDLQNFDMKVRTCPDLHHTVPLYTAPPKREWVGLTNEEIEQGPQEVLPVLYGRWGWAEKEAFEAVVAWAEAKLKEKNHG